MNWPFLIGLAVVLTAQTVVLRLLVRTTPPSEAVRPPENELTQRVAQLELTVKGLPSLWEAERTRAEAAANAARVSRARAEAVRRRSEQESESEGDVPRSDGGARETERLSTVPRRVDARDVDPYAASLIQQSVTNLKAI